MYPDYERLNPRLVAIFNEMKAQGDTYINKREWANKGGQQWESEFDLFASLKPEIQELASFCDQGVRHMVKATAQEEALADSRISVVSESWFHVTGHGGYVGVHDHGSCSWCGVYYVQAGDTDDPDNPYSGMTKFYDPRRTTNSIYENRYDPGLMLERPMYIKPRDGMLILFPNYLLHEQTPYFGTRERIMVGENYRVMSNADQA